MITKPKFDESVFVCPGAAIVGDVTLGKNVNVWYNAVLRGDDGAIKVGDNTNVQDCAVLHEETTVGSGCTIGHGAIVHGCTVGDNVLIGMGATVLNGAKIGDNCIVGAGALVTGKMDAPAGSMILGSPAKVVRPLTEEEIESNDMLMVVKNNYYYTGHTENCPMHFIANGDIARLKRLRRYEDFYGFRFADVVLEFPDYEDTEIECRILLDTIASESPSLTREESSRLFYEVEKDYLDVKSKIKRFKEIRENPHFNALQVKFSYAVTCHKAQGGQWKAVFVDRCLFGDEPMTRDMLRWLYTALTRATDKLYLVNFDKKFYE